ncbi:autophagy protein 5 [Pyrenophora tritici-repentis]|uniref:Autophagy protein 5 n=2 Tax=Pyrenophora tritici-repentis TaxID=45151 RepID=A0A2W1EV99_9PLEO|nr:autophagy protein 5 [Pyrenophora tritici-repentis Pt-1C-BFP]KAA8623003.1 Autophagy protein 5 [Pyrenophora tritici-repentis]EDU45444.1 autophagy protein 5 [Pyrenophora tritici-repentis Pt-1C-BFP]KAF7451992.1 Autophagy protein [Pyrenophora tritici-repentis]KAF7574887.1 autophagy protein 5 [Pyrenophora tritici-repentis]KAG9386347.1 Autophagy protein 5 [Pyrenophora tritici-repentis]
MGSKDVATRLRQSTWNGSIPLEIRLHKGDCRTYDESDPYLVQFPRISYLGLLVKKLHGFFARSLIYPDVTPKDAWLSYEGVPLKWHYPLGLLYDLYSGAEPAYPPDIDTDADATAQSQKLETTEEERRRLPWRLTIHFSDYPMDQLVQLDNEDKHLQDMFIHSVKEADYLRTGTGKTVMFLSKEDSTQLWDGVRNHDFALYNPINQKLLNPQGVNLRHLPVRLYLPHAASDGVQEETAPGSLRIVQRLVTPNLSSRQPQTVGTALNQILPTLFPSRRSPLLAQAVLHGAVLPLSASVEELVRATAYLDGWLHIAVVMMG